MNKIILKRNTKLHRWTDTQMERLMDTLIPVNPCKHSFCKGIMTNLTLSQTTNFRLFQTERVCRQQFQVS